MIKKQQDLILFKQELKYLGNESYQTSRKQFEAYLMNFGIVYMKNLVVTSFVKYYYKPIGNSNCNSINQ